MAYCTINKSLINAPIADITLTSGMSGTTFICIPAGAPRTVTLPLPIAGLQYWFRHSTLAAGTIIFNITPTVFAGPASPLLRGYFENSAGAITATGNTSITFTGPAVPGDSIDMLSDGTNWYCIACSSVAAGFTTV